MEFEKGSKRFPGLTLGDSALVALLASQTVLQRRHFDPFPRPSSVRILTRVLNQLPQAYRIAIADWISSSIGRPHEEFKKIDPVKLAAWVLSGYPAERYPGLIMGAPGLAAIFLSGLTGFPFLPQPLLFNARRDMRPDDSAAYLEAGREITEPVLAMHPALEATVHFDPLHDRFLIRRVVFVRFKFLELPPAYKSFIERRLVPGSPVILLDCRYRWLRAEVSERLYFQLGGLGGVSAEEYLEETEALRNYREEWGAPSDASWRIDKAFVEGPESEWGSTGPFLDEAAVEARSAGHHPIRVIHHHPGDLSRLVFRLYKHCWQGSERPKDVYVAAFTHTEPRFPLVTGSLPIWLPFITDDNVTLVTEILDEWRAARGMKEPTGTAYVTLHPSFCAPPDIVQLSTWRDVFSRYFSEVRFPGIDPGRYPYDLGSYVAMYPELVDAAKKASYPGTPFRRPTTTEMTEILGGSRA